VSIATEAPPAGTRQPESPYVGLSSYGEEFAELFFGRESERTLIIGNLRAARLTILYAQSGVGKSSLLKAGVAARLRSLALRSMSERHSAAFVPIVFDSWRDDPLRDLIGQIQRSIEPLVSAPVELPGERLDEVIEHAAAASGATLLVILDQFEDYLLYGARESPPGRFADELARCINRSGLPANFLIAVREDAYAGVGDVLRGKVVNPYANTLSLEHLDREAARQAITRPIEYFNQTHPGEVPMEIDPALVEAVLDGVRTGQVGFGHEGVGRVQRDGREPSRDRIETPYLQLVLSALWERERSSGSKILRAKTLEQLGGAQAIVQSHLERAMARLSESEREAAVSVFNQLVTPSGTKIVHTIPDLAEYGGRSVGEMETLVEKLSSGDQRILRPVAPAPGETSPRVEIFHDVLAPAILAWRSAQTSVRLERERQAAEDRAARELRRARVFRALAGVASALLVVAIVAVVLARVETNRAHQAEHLAVSRELAGEAASDLQNGALSRGVLLSIEAYRHAPTSAAKDSLVRAMDATSAMVADLGGHTAFVTSVAYSANGRLIASGGADNTILLQDVASGRTVRVLRGHTQAVESIAFSPDGKLLVSGGQDGRVIVWSVADGRALRMLREPGAVNSVAYSPTAQLVAAGGQKGRLTLLDPASGRALRTLTNGRAAVTAVAFSLDGRTLAAGSTDGSVTVWNVATDARIRTLKGHTKPVTDARFAPDGRSLAAASQDGSVIIWNPRTGTRLMALRAHTGFVNSVAYSHDGSVLATGGADHNVILWNAATGRELQVLHGHSAGVESVAFSPTSATLASGADDDQVIIWHARPPLLERIFRLAGPADAVAYSPSGRELAVGSYTGAVSLWDASTGRELRVLRGHRARVESVAFSPDGRTVAAGSDDQTVILWNAATGAREHTLRGHTDYVNAVAYSPDGRTLASGSDDQTVILWNAATGAREHTLRGHTDYVFAVGFSPNSRLLASGSADKSIILWDVGSGRRLGTLTGHTAAVDSVAFRPDGRELVSGGADSTVRLWNLSTKSQIGQPLQGQSGLVLSAAFSPKQRIIASAGTGESVALWDASSGLADILPGHNAPIPSIAFSPNGRSLATVSPDRTVQVLGPIPSSVSYGSVVARLCGVVRRSLTHAEYAHFLPGEPYHRTCSNPPAG
jgi:WD40 repeat protein